MCAHTVDRVCEVKEVFNLTNHTLTEEQVVGLAELFPEAELHVGSHGVAFNILAERIQWVEGWIRLWRSRKHRVGLVVGGDTVAFMLLASTVLSKLRSDTYREEFNLTPEENAGCGPLFVAAQVDRRNSAIKFGFNFNGWMTFSTDQVTLQSRKEDTNAGKSIRGKG